MYGFWIRASGLGLRLQLCKTLACTPQPFHETRNPISLHPQTPQTPQLLKPQNRRSCTYFPAPATSSILASNISLKELAFTSMSLALTLGGFRASASLSLSQNKSFHNFTIFIISMSSYSRCIYLYMYLSGFCKRPGSESRWPTRADISPSLAVCLSACLSAV